MTLYRDVLTSLGLDICAGRYPPGQVIPAEPVLCAQLGVSRIVLREAIKGLVAKGMVETRRRTGTVVLEPARWSLLDPEIVTWRAEATGVDRALANDIMELRRIVEPGAARLAAERASPAERQALWAAYRDMERAVSGDMTDKGDKGDYVTADLEFHAIITRACRNPFVHQMEGVIFTVLRIGFERVAGTPGGPARSLPLHRAVCEAIDRAAGLEAEKAVLALLDQAESDLRDRLRARRTLRKPGTAPAKSSAARAGNKQQAGPQGEETDVRQFPP